MFLSVEVGDSVRPDVLVSSANQRKACSDVALSAQRHRQLPCARPGTFMRASAPRSNTSCSGAIVSPAADGHAERISAAAIPWLSSEDQPTYLRTSCFEPSGSASNQPRVVLLSCVP